MTTGQTGTGCLDCGPCGCLIGEDKFSLNDGRPHAGWTNRPAIWGTAGGDEATNTAGVFRFLKPNTQIFSTANPEGIGSNQHGQVKFTPSELAAADGVNLELILGYADDDNYLVASVYNYTSGDDEPCWLLQLLARDTSASNGYYTILLLPNGDPAIIPLRGMVWDQQYILDGCLLVNNYGSYSTGDTLRAKVTTAAGVYVGGVQGVIDGYTTGAKAGLALAYSNYGTGGGDNTKYGEVEFDDWKFEYFRGDDHLSCPNCNGPCLIFADPFTYDDHELDGSACGEEPDCPECYWEVLTGAARIVSGQFELDNGTRVKCLLPHPTNKSSKIVAVDLKWETTIIARVDLGSGYALFDSTTGARQIRLYDNDDNLLDSSAVDSLPAFDGAMYEVEVCYRSSALTATMAGACVDAISTDTEDPFVYLGSSGGTVHFDNFSFSKTRDLSEPKDSDCDDCTSCAGECVDCAAGTRPGILIGTINSSGSAEADCTNLTHCDRLDGTAWALEENPGAYVLCQSCAWDINSSPDITLFDTTDGDTPYPCPTYPSESGRDLITARLTCVRVFSDGRVTAAITISEHAVAGGNSYSYIYEGQLPASGSDWDCSALDGMILTFDATSTNACCAMDFGTVLESCVLTDATITLEVL